MTDNFVNESKLFNFDYYKIIGIESDATQTQIKQAYHAKLKKYHPDKVEQTKENIAKYKLIRLAGDILNNPLERRAYDLQRTMETPSYMTHKNTFNEFTTLQKQSITEEHKNIAITEFNESINKITKDDIDRRLEDITLFRDTEENEFDIPTEKYDNKQFNNLFNKTIKKNMIQENDILASNDYEDGFGNGIIQYERLDSENNNHNMPNEFHEQYDLETELKKIMDDRKQQNNMFENLETSDYGSALDDKYGISRQLGFIVGSDKYSQQKNINIDISKTYKELTQT
jgi:curved DNA-binding protein CbpA